MVISSIGRLRNALDEGDAVGEAAELEAPGYHSALALPARKACEGIGDLLVSRTVLLAWHGSDGRDSGG